MYHCPTNPEHKLFNAWLVAYGHRTVDEHGDVIVQSMDEPEIEPPLTCAICGAEVEQ
jgi:hypothetical protein